MATSTSSGHLVANVSKRARARDAVAFGDEDRAEALGTLKDAFPEHPQLAWQISERPIPVDRD